MIQYQLLFNVYRKRYYRFKLFAPKSNHKKITEDSFTYYLDRLPIVFTNMLFIKLKSVYVNFSNRIIDDIENKLNMVKLGICDESMTLVNYIGNHMCNTDPDNEIDIQTYVFVCNISCKENTDVILMAHNHGIIYNLWINDIFIGRSTYDDILQIPLRRGDNYFCFVMPKLVSSPKMFIRVIKCTSKQENFYTPKVVSDDYADSGGIITLLDLEYHWNERDIYRGILYAYNQIDADISQDVTVTVLDYYSAEIYFKNNIKFNEPFEINMKCVPHFDNSRLNFFRIHIEYRFNDGRLRNIDKFFSFEQSLESSEKLCHQFLKKIYIISLIESLRNFMEYLKYNLS